MKKFIVSLVALVAFVSGAAFADTVSVGAHLGNSDQRYYEVGVAHDVGANVVVTAQGETEQSAHNDLLSQQYSAKVGYKVAVPFGITVVPSVEYGVKLVPGANDQSFYGAGVSASRQIYGPVSGEVTYRYRSSFVAGPAVAENRVSAAVTWAIDAHDSVSLDAHTYTGNPSLLHVFGVSYSYKF